MSSRENKVSINSKTNIVGMQDKTLANKILPNAGNQIIQIIFLIAIVTLIIFAIICYKKSKIY